jgi:hypothetical protein
MDTEKAQAELVVLREFIDFVNRQVGVYCDCLSGFQGNKVRIERQMPRLLRPTSRRIQDGQPVVMYASVEDPARPEVLHHRIIRADEFMNVNSEAGFNEQQICWSIIVFLFAYWDEEIRPRIADVRRVKPNDVKIDALGDLRLLRRSIVHNAGIITAEDHAKLKVMADVCRPNERIAPKHDDMHRIFVLVKQAIAKLMLDYSGHLPGAPKAEEIVSVAIQNVGKPR